MMTPETLEAGTSEDGSSPVPTRPETLRYAVSLDTIDSGETLTQLFPCADRIKCTLRVLDKIYVFETEEIHLGKPVKWESWNTVEVPNDVVNPKGNNTEKNVGENDDSNASADKGVHEAKDNTMVILEMTGISASWRKNEFITLIGEIEAAKLFHPCGASYRCNFRKKDEKSSLMGLTVFSSPLDEDLENGLNSLRVYIYDCTRISGYEATFLHTNGEETVQESKSSRGGIVSFQAKHVSGLRITGGQDTVAVHLKDVKNTTVPSWHSGKFISAYCPYSVCKSALERFERLGKIFVRVQPQLEKVDKALMANVLSRDAALEMLSSTGGAIEFTSEEDKGKFFDALESNGMGGIDTEALIQLLADLDEVIAQSDSGAPPETREKALQRILVRLLLAVLLPNPERRTQETEKALVEYFVNEQRRTSNQADPATQPTMPDLDYELRSFKETLGNDLEDLVALHEAIHVPESCFDLIYMRAFSNAFSNASDDSIETKLLQAARRSDFETCKRILQTHSEIDPLSARDLPISRGEEKSVSAMHIRSFDLHRLQFSYQSSLDYLISAIARIHSERNAYDLTLGSKDKEMNLNFKAAKLKELQSAREVVAIILERVRDIGQLGSDTFARALRSFDVKTLQLMGRNEEICRAVNQTEAWEFVFSNWRSHSDICSELAEVLLAVQVANVSHQALSCSESGVFHCPNDTTTAAETLRALFRQRLGDKLTLGILRKLLRTRQCKSDDILISLYSQAVTSSSSSFGKYSPFHLACELGYTECVQEFISHGANIDLHDTTTGQSALQVAIENRRIEILRILCKSGASCSTAIAKDGKTPLHLAIEMKCPEMVAVLCENGAESDDKALLDTTELGHGEILQILKNDGKAFPERYRGELDRTLLHLACNKPDAGDDNFVQMLIQMNVAVNEVDMIGRTALHNAAAMGNLSAVRSLLEAGADETLPTRREGSTVIHEAAKMGRISVLQFVLKNSSGETVDAVDMQGRTPLCYAFKRRRFLELTFYCLRELQESAQETCLRECHLAPEMEEFAQLMKERYGKFDSSFREAIDSADALRGIGSTREMAKLASFIKNCFQESENHELSTEDLRKVEVAPEMKAFVGWIKKSYRALDPSSRNFKAVELSEVVRDLHLHPLMRYFVYLIIRSCEKHSMLEPEKKEEDISKSLEGIESSYELNELAALIKRRIDVADTSCKTANEIRVFKSNLKLVSGSAFSPYTRFECLPNFDGELLSYFPQDICQDLQDLKTGFKDEKGLQATLLDCFEELFVEIRKADAVLGILLDAGADIDHVDDQGNPAFDDDYRIEYFKTREKELRAALEKRSKLAHDQPIFKGKIVHHAVHAAWVQQGLRFKACRALAYWVILLILLTLVAIRYSGRDVYESFSIQASIANRMSSGDAGTLEDVKDLDSWNDYVENVFVEAIWPSESDLHVENDSVIFGEGLVLLGRPRYRQIRTRADSCSTTMPSLLSEAATSCYAPYSQGTFSSLDATIEDRSPYTCMLSDAGSHVISWEDSPAVPFFGKFGFYKGGGSSVVLLSNKTATQQLLQDLRACEFISMGTRLAALEITLYSRSHELFVHGRVFMEHTTTGGVFANQRWETRKLVSYESTEDRHQVWKEVAMVLFFLGHFFSEIFRLLVSTCRSQKIETGGASEQVVCNGDDFGTMPNLNNLMGVVVLDPEEQQWWLCNVSKTKGSSRRIVSMDHSRSFALEHLKWIETWGFESGPRRFNVGELVRVSKGPGREECNGFIVSINECDKRWTYSVLDPEDKSGGSKLIQNLPEDAIKAEPGIALTELRRCGSTKDPSLDAKSRRSERGKCQRDPFRPRSWISGAQKVWQSIRADGIVKTCSLGIDNLPAYWSDPFNYLDLSIMFLFFGLVATHMKLINIAAQRSSDWLENAGRDVYIDVSDLMWLSTVRQYLLGGVVFLCYLKTLEYLRVAATFAIPVMIIIGMLVKLMSFLAILAVFVMAFGIFDYVVFGLKYAPVNSVMKALVFTLRGALGELDFDGKYEMDQVVGTGMTMLAAVLLVILLLNLLIAVMSEAYEDVKATAEARWCYRQYMAIHRRQKKEELSQWVYVKGKDFWCELEPFRAYFGLDWSEKYRPSWARKWSGRSSRVTPSDAVDEGSQVKSA